MQARVAALRRSAPESSGARTFSGDELTNGVNAAGIQNVRGLDPPAARGAESETHLPSQCVRTMAVTVNGHGDSEGDRPAGEGTVHVQVSRRAIDFHRGPRFSRGAEEPVEIDVVTGEAPWRAVRRMGDDVDEGVADGTQISFGQPTGFVTAVIVQRREHDVESFELRVVEVQRAIVHDVDFDAMKDLDSWNALSQPLDLAPLPWDVRAGH